MAEKEELARIGISILILLLGIIIAKIVSQLVFKIRRNGTGQVRQDTLSKIVRDIIVILTIFGVIFFLMDGVFVLNLDIYISILPMLFSFLLILIISILLANLILRMMRWFLKIAGIDEYFEEMQAEGLLAVIFLVFRIFLYFLLFYLSLNLIREEYPQLVAFFYSFLSWIVIATIALLFYSSSKLVQNLVSGIYLLISDEYRLGQSVVYKQVKGNITKIGYFKTKIEAEDGYELVIPNSALVSERFFKKDLSIELKTLENLKDRYVAQLPSYCGPASAEMVLDIFGFRVTQEKVGEICNTKKGVGTAPLDLIKAVQEITKGKVLGAWVAADKISDLNSEVRQWLKDDGLIIADFFKKDIFKNAKAGHYVVVVAVEGQELVIIDPSSKRGGVYFIESSRMHKAMDTYSDVIKGKRGYIVLAPSGTTAHFKIKNGMISRDTNLYQEMKGKLRRKIKNLKTKFMPASIRDFIEKYREDKISRIWSP